MKKFLFPLLILCCITSCNVNVIDDLAYGVPGVDYPTSENTDFGIIEYQYNDNVIVIDKELHRFLLKCDENGVVVFDKSLPEDKKPFVGCVLTSSVIDDITPYGLNFLVNDIVYDNNTITCLTTQASLEDTFSSLVFNADIPIITDTIQQPILNAYGEIMDYSIDDYDATKVSVGSPKVITLNLGGKLGGERMNVFATGSLSIGAVATIDIDLQKHQSECSLSVYAGLKGEIGGKVNGEKFFDLLKEKWNVVTGVVAIGPIVLRPSIDIMPKLHFSGDGTLSTSLSKQYGIKVGFKNGKAFSQNLTDSNTDIIQNINLDIKGSAELVADFYFGVGLYTKNVAAGIEPSISVGVSADFLLLNLNLFRNHPELEFYVKASANGYFIVEAFGKEFTHEQLELVSVDLFSYKWPLLPELVENSLHVEKRDVGGPLVFDAEYQLDGGLLTDIAQKLGSKCGMLIFPSFRVYKGGEEVYHIIDDQELTARSKQTLKYELTDLEKDISYTGKPSLFICGGLFDENGVPFSSKSPSVAITDIVQTGASSGSFHHNGHDYEYEFYFNVVASIVGSENCTEWGLYDPSSVDIYNPFNTLEDGSYTQYWTGWSNSPSASWTKTPYVILKEDGSYKTYETYTHTTTYGGYYSIKNSLPVQSCCECRLDSVVYNKPDYTSESTVALSK